MSMRVLNTKACVHPSLYYLSLETKIVIEAPSLPSSLQVQGTWSKEILLHV
jgi:hypothetical protein